MSSSNSPCAACKLLRRKCTQGCVFAPYFPPDQPAKFANVHKVFGASNVSKLLNELPVVQREDAVNSLAYEAEARLRDPVYGCVAYISVLQLKIKQVREEIANARKELSGYIGQAAYAPIVPVQHPHAAAAAAAQYAAMGLVQPHPHQHQHQQMAMQQQPYHQQIAEAQHLAAAVEVARSGGQGQHHQQHHHQQQQHHHHQHQQHEMMMMRQTYGNVHGAAAGPTIAVDPPTQGAAYDGTAPFLIQQQQPSPSALTYRMEEPSPPPQSSGHSHVDMSRAPQQHHQHTDGSDEGSGGAPPS
ncbi:hypothetical protein ZWY2020_053250 [Hordeum vulgare]|nr:hypothetical protein ZWY2020_053250 [Hordeum vulgare]